MAATVHVGVNTNTTYTNNTGTNVRIIIYYLKVSDCSTDNTFYISYGDSNQLAGGGRPSELLMTEAGTNYIGTGGEGAETDTFTWPTTAVTGTGTGMSVDGKIYGNSVTSTPPHYPRPHGDGGTGNPYAIGDILDIAAPESNRANNWTPAKVTVTDLQGHEAVRIPFSVSTGFAIGANLASSGYSHYTSTQTYKSTSVTSPIQNAAPFGADGRMHSPDTVNRGYTFPTEIFISNGQSFELYRVGSASTQMQYNFVAIPEGG